jgi:hypothetical protein
MAQARRAMSKAQREELIEAIRSNRIENASRFSEDFAARHDLNPVTVRSTISRLRKELGLVELGQGRWIESPEPPAVGGLDERLQWYVTAMLLTGGSATARQLARPAAAMQLRYENDEEFRRAVDEAKPMIKSVYEGVIDLTNATKDLAPDERAALLRLLNANPDRD